MCELICVCMCALCTLECVSIWKYWCVDAWMRECMNVWMWLERPYELHMTGDSMEQDITCKIGGGLTAQYKHSANFLGVDIRNKTGHVRLEADWRCSTNTRQTSLELILSWTNRAIGGMKPDTRWQPIPLGKPAHCRSKVWEKSPFVSRHAFFSTGMPQ